MKDSPHRRPSVQTEPNLKFKSLSEVNMLGIILIVFLTLALIGAVPAWPHSKSWGYYPSGGIGLVLVLVVVLLFMGTI
jgi:Protein of unknown function (DUF3309)